MIVRGYVLKQRELCWCQRKALTRALFSRQYMYERLFFALLKADLPATTAPSGIWASPAAMAAL